MKSVKIRSDNEKTSVMLVWIVTKAVPEASICPKSFNTNAQLKFRFPLAYARAADYP